MWGEQNQQIMVTCLPSLHLESVCMCWRQISPLTIWSSECTPAEMWVTPARDSTWGHRFPVSPLLPEAPLDGSVQLFVKHRPERSRSAAVCVDPLLCSEGHLNASFHSYVIPRFWLFLFFTATCAQRKALWSVSGSIADKAMHSGNFQPVRPSIVCLCVFW